MTLPNDGSVVTVVSQDPPSFTSNGVDLKDLSKKLSKLSQTALNTLEKLLASPDEKMRYQAAKTILELDVSVKDKINTDSLQRLIAEVKLRMPIQDSPRLVGSSTADGQPKPRPVVDFENIRTV